MPLNIPRIVTADPSSAEAIELLRRKLAPSGEVVSEAGRKKTIEVFGIPLSPTEVVERISSDVRTRGLESVLDYTAKFDKVKLAPEAVRVPERDLVAAHAAVGATFLETIRRIRDNILRFQTAILHRDVHGPQDAIWNVRRSRHKQKITTWHDNPRFAWIEPYRLSCRP